jgi:hypothetical protein
MHRVDTEPLHPGPKIPLWRDHNALVHALRSFSDPLPAIEGSYTLVRAMGVVRARPQACNGFGTRSEHVRAVRTGERYHVRWKDLRHTPDARGDDVEAGAGGLQDGDPKRLGEGRVQEDVSSHKHLQAVRRRRDATRTAYIADV